MARLVNVHLSSPAVRRKKGGQAEEMTERSVALPLVPLGLLGLY